MLLAVGQNKKPRVHPWLGIFILMKARATGRSAPMALRNGPPPTAPPTYRQHLAPGPGRGDGGGCGARTVGISFWLPGALLEALSAHRDRAPDSLQRGLGHVGASCAGGCWRRKRRASRPCLVASIPARAAPAHRSLVVNRVGSESCAGVRHGEPPGCHPAATGLDSRVYHESSDGPRNSVWGAVARCHGRPPQVAHAPPGAPCPDRH